MLLIVSVLGGSTFAYQHRGATHRFSLEQVQECQDKQAYLDLVMPAYKDYCKRFGIRYPGILALQVFYEVGSGFPQQLSEVARTDNNLGGLKYAEGIPYASQGLACPANEGGYYCHFKSVGQYYYVQCWQIGQSFYDEVRAKESVEEFSRCLCNMWIGGVAGSDPYGYSESLIQDYYYYHLDEYEN